MDNTSDRFILIGHPVGHSASPAIHQRAYKELGRQGSYELCDCPDETQVRAQVALIRSGELSGANVTVPWKRVAYDAADELHSSARDVGVANVLARGDQGQVVGYNTDALALAEELRDLTQVAKIEVDDTTAAVIVGAGGAALAASVGLRLLGVRRIFVTARRFDPAVVPAEWPGVQEFARLSVSPLPWPGFAASELRHVFGTTRFIVQASSAGMLGIGGGDELTEILPWDALPQRAVAYDLVYNPPLTPFLERAAQEGLTTRGGLGMLVGQAAQAIRIWWGEQPELAPLMRAAQEKLGL